MNSEKNYTYSGRKWQLINLQPINKSTNCHLTALVQGLVLSSTCDICISFIYLVTFFTHIIKLTMVAPPNV